MPAHDALLREIRRRAVPLRGLASDFQPLLDWIGDARVVCIGDATHGTSEFHDVRALLTKRLIADHGRDAIAMEGDMRACGRANRFVLGDAAIDSAADALSGFPGFPSWMWRNPVMADFLDWLRRFNATRPTPRDRTGIHGLDLPDSQAAGTARSRWNLRDQSMMRRLAALLARLDQDRGRPARIVVWAHNSHVGDARATQMGGRGEVSLGQLARERLGGGAVRLVGHTTFRGTLTSAAHWHGETEQMALQPAIADSWEGVFHEAGIGDFWLGLGDSGGLDAGLRQSRPQRAIGVIYQPRSERRGHYVLASLAGQFDAVIHIDTTSALAPLETPEKRDGERPRTMSDNT